MILAKIMLVIMELNASMVTINIDGCRFRADFVILEVKIFSGGTNNFRSSPPQNSMGYHSYKCWRDETARSSISHGLVSKIIPNLPILGNSLELRGIMVNMGRIHRELRYF